MLSFIPITFHALSKELTIQEALSGIFGSISLATWIFLLVSGVGQQLGDEAEDMNTSLGVSDCRAGATVDIELQDGEC